MNMILLLMYSNNITLLLVYSNNMEQEQYIYFLKIVMFGNAWVALQWVKEGE